MTSLAAAHLAPETLYGLLGALLIGLGLFGFLVHRQILRRILAFNVIGSGTFLLFGAVAVRAEDAPADPVPHAMIITGIVVALAATALAVALAVRLVMLDGQAARPEDALPEDTPPEDALPGDTLPGDAE